MVIGIVDENWKMNAQRNAKRDAKGNVEMDAKMASPEVRCREKPVMIREPRHPQPMLSVKEERLSVGIEIVDKQRKMDAKRNAKKNVKRNTKRNAKMASLESLATRC